jgi:hypothetical protein
MQIRAIVLVVVSAVFAAATATADTPAEKCEAGKLKEAGKFLLCRLKAEAKAVPGGAAETAKCDAKLASKWAGLESKAAGACPTNGDGGAEGEALAGDVARTAWRLSGGPRFVDNGDGTITDRQTRLMWEKKVRRDAIADAGNPHDADNVLPVAGQCSLALSTFCQPTGQASELCGLNAESGVGCSICLGGEGTCSAPATIWTWAVGLNAASFAGHNNWRIPTRAELQSIVDYAATPPPVVASAFHGAGCGAACSDLASAACSCTAADFHATASSYMVFPADPWAVDFYGGAVFPDSITSDRHFRAVRALP